MRHADALFQAQHTLAVGSIRVFRIDEEEDDNGKTKRVHVLVTEPDEIKQVLDEHEGGSGVVGENYYYVSEVPPDNRAIDSLLNRALGKPTEHKVIEKKNPDLDRSALALMAAMESLGRKIELDQAREYMSQSYERAGIQEVGGVQ